MTDEYSTPARTADPTRCDLCWRIIWLGEWHLWWPRHKKRVCLSCGL